MSPAGPFACSAGKGAAWPCEPSVPATGHRSRTEMQAGSPAQSQFRRHAEGKVVVYADGALVPPEGVRDLIGLPQALKGLRGSSSRSAGRASVWRWSPSWRGGHPLVVRQFVHGGVLRRLWADLFLTSRPMLGEVRVGLHALGRGVPTCRPVALRLERVWGPLLRAHYVTEEIEGAENLLEFCLRPGGAADCPPAQRQALAAALARTIAAMHEAGISHGDLNLKNLLVVEGQGEAIVCVVDFKKARLMDRVALKARLRGMVRLDRSVVKWPASRRAVTVTDRLRVLRNYLRLQPEAGGNWKDIARRVRTSHAPHAVSSGREAPAASPRQAKGGGFRPWNE